jgi:glycosyltransferase involved in cell wall biosynthesis
VTTVPVSLPTHLSGQLTYLRRLGFDLHVVVSDGPELAPFAAREGVPVYPLEMARAITPLRDLRTVLRLARLLRALRPEVVHSHTPKGGLLGMIAATLARTPVRVYHLRGLPFVTARGARRALLRATERVSCLLAHRVLAVSHSIREVAVEEGLCPAGKIRVLLGGSGNGVDAERYRPASAEARRASRARVGIPEDALVIGFVGRLTRDKGIAELAEAWGTLRAREPRLHLLVVGWDELGPGLEAVGAALRADARVRCTGPVDDAAPLYAAMDVLALPTYREGFPNVALEAAAAGLPVVGTATPGCQDAVLDGVTGRLVPAQDAEALAEALAPYLAEPDLRARHGAAGRARVVKEFRREAIWDAIAEEYRTLLAPVTALRGART